AFGAFVDIGVHQDGLVHVSALSHGFVRDPREAVKAGDIVKVKVMEIDLARPRIALSMRLDDVPGESRAARGGRDERSERGAPRNRAPAKPAPPPAGGALADAFARALKR